ncbi:hypothetical protein FH966_14745 [Lentibacillus cibarius]|uniref:Uncharacterized protein n=1 Tax=Lentibacillus cibarius TaxID=2583219 RepID=A0A549YA92_9BACI|nr:hypothetical protein [Lentibacillus cibarius]TRM08786.1 hypothetical protein FH966_16560 [Lentibacillus cibarius]TRM08814.1 hypothetical protein FH966_16705 [Lentibacillus cibarius]TRM12860.1 hypothetical protein FH966_14745 [Lentibacillus cibarius]
MQNSAPKNDTGNAEKLQTAISDDLFPQAQHISDVKQVIEAMESKSQNLREPQIKALLLIKKMGENKYLHDKNPYDDLYKYITGQGKKDVANPEYYLNTIEELIPKPPKPIVMAPDGKGAKK